MRPGGGLLPLVGYMILTFESCFFFFFSCGNSLHKYKMIVVSVGENIKNVGCLSDECNASVIRCADEVIDNHI